MLTANDPGATEVQIADTPHADSKSFWLTERAHQVVAWLRREEAEAKSERQRVQVERQAAAQLKDCHLGYVDRLLSAQGDAEVLIWRALRLLLVVMLCVLACSIIGMVVIVLVAAQQVGPAKAAATAGGALSMVTTGGMIGWRVVHRKKAQPPA